MMVTLILVEKRLIRFLKSSSTKDSELKHLWDTKEIADDLRRQIGQLYAAEKLEKYLALTGSDLVRINGDKIINLKVKSDS